MKNFKKEKKEQILREEQIKYAVGLLVDSHFNIEVSIYWLEDLFKNKNVEVEKVITEYLELMSLNKNKIFELRKAIDPNFNGV
ncbi:MULTISPECIES: hypothetical protein [Pasteurellaceae]|uniref:Uncharacterized protein n=1 Tax=Pasteurella atlantica TaxID=2827233 RepID=A0AAW8CNT4_9PAST|nr:hypothetical protein [Pasteurella atlantica]MBR0573709.1 hypothetical protein [Pasteurella atlantica]MDP8039656.1 hypothetical protein [Pasteurella atlantica]MDP8041747.1 hypothetical protein [Pasteurella atlantica]MDP8043979.1 hypothetical protein [Pasteurella atlantica]MDP8045957.1 hypothetical protein [Pasteurella atlantica]